MELSQEIYPKYHQQMNFCYQKSLIKNEFSINQQYIQNKIQENNIKIGQPPSSDKGDKETNLSLQYFKSFFSSKDTAKSLQKRNDNLQMMKFQNSDQQPDDVYNRRKKKVEDLMDKQQHQISIIQEIKKQSQSKFAAIIQFVKFFCLIKNSLGAIRTDYYSNKTFCAIKNASQQQLKKITKVIQRMYTNVMNSQQNSQISFHSNGENVSQKQEKKIQFLIIPRFLISKQKLNRLARDEELQKNFEFLVSNVCLGHYNNQANKKMPEEKQMKFVRQLLTKKSGRQKFKRICSINHGNKFLKSYGNSYYNLYSQSLQYLKQLESSLKKGKKYQNIKKDLQKLPLENRQTIGNQSINENESSNNLYSFKSFGQCLNKMQDEQSLVKSQMAEQPAQFKQIQSLSSMRKFQPRKLFSLPNVEIKKNLHEVVIVEEARKFGVRRFQSDQAKQTQNIILIPPPTHFQI